MLDHVEKIFADMKPMMKKLKKASYKVNMEAFIENHGHYFREMTEYTENASDKETAAKELAVDFTDKVYDAYGFSEKRKNRQCCADRSEFLYDLLCISGNSFDRA